MTVFGWSDLDAPSWAREGADWPNRAASRFVRAAGLGWHVQDLGEGPPALLLHGTGAATHSWRDIAPLLAPEFRVIAPDLPGHGFTESPPKARMTLPGMATSLRGLLDALACEPALVVGHSAGAAVAVHLALEGLVTPQLIVGLNAALFPYRGVGARVLAPVARVLSRTSIAPLIVATRARDPANVDRLIRGTGSRLDAHGTDLYRRLVRKPSHVAAALAMMARWDLSRMGRDLARLDVPLLLLAGDRDEAVAPVESERAARRAPRGRCEAWPGLGHLAHEEQPEATARRIGAAFREAGEPGAFRGRNAPQPSASAPADPTRPP